MNLDKKACITAICFTILFILIGETFGYFIAALIQIIVITCIVNQN